MFIVVHIKPHTEKQGLQPAYECKDKGHSINIRNVTGYSPHIKKPYSQRKTDAEEEEGEYIKKDQGMKIFDDIFKK
jgi:hypothetical protein